MSPYRADRRNDQRRRRSSGYGSYSGPERRSGRDRRRTGGRRGYDHRRSDANGDDYEGHYYGAQKKQQNPMMFVGIAGGVILLIIIIAVAASGSSDGNNPSYTGGGSDYSESTADLRQRADELVYEGGEEWERAKIAKRESGQTAANPFFQRAYSCFEQAHHIYEDLDKRHPNTEFAIKMQNLERDMYEVQKSTGTE
jgi:hypothetical protein